METVEATSRIASTGLFHSHSLGILIEWKLDKIAADEQLINIPTRWGY